MLAVEVQTNRGLITDERAVGLTRVARELADSGRVDVICISDNPFGSPHLESQVLGADLLSRGQEVVINFSCKDLNRNAIESRLWALGSAGLHNVLAVTGDYPLDGFAGAPRPVFDTDSVGLLEMMRRMNQGLPTSGRTGERGSGRLQPTAFYPAATVNPFKRREDELVPQFRKLVKKVSVGARWIITQLGFDFRRLDELRRFTRLSGLDAPFIGSVYVLDLPAARYFRRGAVPGVSISDGLLELIERRAGGKDRGRAFFNEFAAKQTAILRGLGFRGVYMCCRSPLARFDEILEIESTLDAGDWRDFVRELSFPERGGFYLYEADGDTGLSRDELSREYLASKSKRRGRLKRLSYPGAVLYGANRLVHETLFKPERAGFRLGRALYRRAERSRTAGRLLHAA
ncbi:MAG: methylenetetrahydrofolate reductase, partial [Gemmatimonadetes bacterium]|nr:methylenetetrahydrofolate reductase [Gemmatimonadota bacterium]